MCLLAGCTTQPWQLYQGMESPTGPWALMWAASLVAVTGFLVALWRLPRWLARFPLRDIVLAACTFGLAFVAITLPYQAVVVVVASALGPFMFLVEGLFYKAILFAVLGTFFAAVPRPGVYLLFYLLWMVAQALFSGWYAYGPVTLLFAGVAVASMEAALWLGGVTRAAGTHRKSVLWPAIAIGLGELAIVYWDLLLIRALYRLYLPQWFMWLEAGSAALYAAVGASFGLRMGHVLVGLRRPPLPESPAMAQTDPLPTAGAPLLEVANLSFAHAGVPVLRDVSLTLQPGQITLITGPTGCGKTTLLRLIQGLLPLEEPSAVRWCGASRDRFSPHQWAQRCALLFQESAVQFVGTAPADEIALGLRLAGRKASPDAVSAELAQHGLTPLAERLPQRLSGGELQQVVLASLLAGQPRVLLLDEPLAQLDDAARERLPGWLRELARGGMAVLVTVHRTAPLLRVADHVIV
ncbi:MAG TPA: ABC transporter ATP-binding protein, partial [bacterium]